MSGATIVSMLLTKQTRIFARYAGEGLSHTVDEVSELLDVPRPTLYRYLKEYSIPHVRRSGKIDVPDECFDRIKEVRELHKEGLATESVRRRLQGDRSELDDELAQQLHRISGTLENLQMNLKMANGESFAQTLQTISVQQNVLISAVFDLTEMLENLLETKWRSRKARTLETWEAKMERQETSFEAMMPFRRILRHTMRKGLRHITKGVSKKCFWKLRRSHFLRSIHGFLQLG
jgi:excisionase family DNA binding protein